MRQPCGIFIKMLLIEQVEGTDPRLYVCVSGSRLYYLMKSQRVRQVHWACHGREAAAMSSFLQSTLADSKFLTRQDLHAYITVTARVSPVFKLLGMNVCHLVSQTARFVRLDKRGQCSRWHPKMIHMMISVITENTIVPVLGTSSLSALAHNAHSGLGMCSQSCPSNLLLSRKSITFTSCQQLILQFPLLVIQFCHLNLKLFQPKSGV